MDDKKREALFRYRRDLLGIKLESDVSDQLEENTSKKAHKKAASVSKKDKDLLEIDAFAKILQKQLKKRPPTADLGQLSLEKGKQLTVEDLEPIYLDYDVIEYCTAWIEKHPDAISTEGIYRISGDSVFVKHMWACFVLENPTFLDHESVSPNIITGALKLYLRELKDPLMPFDFYDKFVSIVKVGDDPNAKIPSFKELVSQLDPISQNSLSCLCKHLKVVTAKEDINKMGYDNVSIVFGPTVMRPKVEDMNTMMDNNAKFQVVSLLVEFSADLFVNMKELPEKGNRSLAPFDPKKKKKEKEDKKKTDKKKHPVDKVKRDFDMIVEEKEEAEPSEKKKDKPKLSNRAYGDIIATFDSEDTFQLIGASLVFINKMEEDSKNLLKYISKNQTPEHLATIILKLAKIVAQGAKKEGPTINLAKPKQVSDENGGEDSKISSPISPADSNASIELKCEIKDNHQENEQKDDQQNQIEENKEDQN